MNDYGHHPTEIRASLRAIRECFAATMRRFIVVFQPHRYSRTKLCWDEFLTSFGDADSLLVTEVYAASEEEIVGISGDSFCEAIQHTEKRFIAAIDDVPALLRGELQAGDLVLCLGAGSVGSLPEKILSAFSETPSSEIAVSAVSAAAEIPATSLFVAH
jgi:UDP-N-acetylmuramate--alanine ligase